jgi:phenylacetate-CoA ligase
MNSFLIPKQRYDCQLYHIFEHKKHQWLKERDLVKIQEKKLKPLINHAYVNVPYYHDLFDSIKIKPYDIKTIRDLKKIPILTKKNVRENYPKKIVAKGTNLKKCHISKTTGSTGTPLKICFSNKDYNYRTALYKYIYLESGVSLFDKIITIRAPSDKVKKSWFAKLRVLIFKDISIYNPIDNIAKELVEHNPDFIITYPSMLSLLATEIKEKKISGIRPKLIMAMSETLTNPMRDKLSKSFDSEIIRHYGSEEFGSLAFECKSHSGYHIITDNVILEFLKDGKDVNPGESGEVIITGLENYTMPLIRYKLGDIAIPLKEKCSCGRGLPLIREIEGRQDDYLSLPSGKKISPRMINVIENIPGIKAYKTIQENKKKIVVKLVKSNEFNEKTITEVKEQIKIGCLGEDIQVEVDLVEEIPKERTGKLRTVISKVN